MAAYVQSEDPALTSTAAGSALTEGRRRAKLGLDEWGTSDMFSLSALVDLCSATQRSSPPTSIRTQRVPRPRLAHEPAAGDLDAVLAQDQRVGVFTPNQQLMLWTVALFAQHQTDLNARSGQSPAGFNVSGNPCTGTTADLVNDLGQVGADVGPGLAPGGGPAPSTCSASSWIATVKYGFPEIDSPTYATTTSRCCG